MDYFPLCRREGCRTTPRPGYADLGLCMRDERLGQEAVRDLPRLYIALGGIWFDRPAPKWSNTLRVFGPSDPLNTNAIGLQWEIGWMLDQWTEIVAERGGLTEHWEILDDHYRLLLGAPVCSITGTDWKIIEMDGVEAVVAFINLHGRARVLDPAREKVEQVPGACGNCGRTELRHVTNSDDVRCEHCRVVITWGAYYESQYLPVTA